MRWPLVLRSTMDAEVCRRNNTIDSLENSIDRRDECISILKEERSEWKHKAIALDKENREMKSEIERLLGIINEMAETVNKGLDKLKEQA